MQAALELTAKTTDREYTVEGPSEELRLLWERVGARELDTWQPLPRWCLALHGSGADDEESDHGYSSLLKSYLAEVDNGASGTEYSTWLRGMFERLGGRGHGARTPVR